MGIKAVQSQKQQALVSTTMIHSLEILQMTDLELSEYISNAAADNCMLDMEKLDSKEPSVLISMKYHDFQSPTHENNSEDPETHNEPGLYFDWQDSLETHLMMQLAQMNLSDLQLSLSRYFIQCIDSRGYLNEDLYTTSQLLGVEMEEILTCVARLRSLSPKGICAQDLQHCLLAQLNPVEDPPFLTEIIEHHLRSLSLGHYSQISKSLGIAPDDVHFCLQRIRTLSPFPSSGFESKSTIEYIVPDVYISNENGALSVSLHKSYSKSLGICPYYEEMLEKSRNEELTAYLEDKLRKAKLLIKNVALREETTMACIKNIVQLQKEFFTGRSNSLQPMSLEDVANLSNIHISTVSRALKGKYLQYDGKTIPVRSLFSRKLDENSSLSSSDFVKVIIREVIDSEDKSHPLTDSAICNVIKCRGLNISRRTVAKYREQLDIPSVFVRKEA